MSLLPYKVTAIKDFDATGQNVMPYASVSVLNKSGGYAALKTDETGAASLGNPFNCDVNGEKEFWILGGSYIITVDGGQSWEIHLSGASDIQFIENVAALASTPVVAGRTYYLKEYYSGTGKGGRELVGKAGSTTYDNGFTFAGSGGYFQSLNLGSIVDIFIFGGQEGGDIYAPLTAAKNYLAGLGGGVIRIPASTLDYTLSNQFVVDVSNILITGDGCSRYHDGGTPTKTTTVKFTGPAVAAFSFETPAGAGNSVRTGGGMKNININGNALATIGLSIISWRGATFEDIYSHDCTLASFQSACLNPGTFAEAGDTQFCRFARLSWRNIDSAAVQSANGFVLSGSNDTLANTSFNIIEGCTGQTYNGIGFLLPNADNNQFIGCSSIRTNGTAVPGLEIRGGADANHFIDYSCGGAGGIRIKGTASGYPSNPIRNTFYAMDEANGTQYPTMDAGCRVSWHSDGGFFQKLRIAVAVLGTSSTQVNAEDANVTSETLRIRNGASNAIRITDSVNEWGLNIDGVTGDFRINRVSGSGAVNIGNGLDVKFAGGIKHTAGAAAPTTGTWARGDVCWNNQPAVGSPKGWRCTVAGTPGTWVSEGNL